MRRSITVGRRRRVIPLLFERLECRVNPGFLAPLAYDVGQGPVSVAVADVNEDGIPDLIVANKFSNDLSVLLGNGDGTFQVAGNVSAGIQPTSVAVGDFNGDGVLDLVECRHSSDGSPNGSAIRLSLDSARRRLRGINGRFAAISKLPWNRPPMHPRRLLDTRPSAPTLITRLSEGVTHDQTWR